jgi:hypothetical protein
MTPRVRRIVLLSGWVLLQRPAGWTEPGEPPLDRWTRLKHFSSAEACQSYRDKSLGADAQDASKVRCVADEASAAPAKPAHMGGW